MYRLGVYRLSCGSKDQEPGRGASGGPVWAPSTTHDENPLLIGIDTTEIFAVNNEKISGILSTDYIGFAEKEATHLTTFEGRDKLLVLRYLDAQLSFNPQYYETLTDEELGQTVASFEENSDEIVASLTEEIIFLDKLNRFKNNENRKFYLTEGSGITWTKYQLPLISEEDRDQLVNVLLDSEYFWDDLVVKKLNGAIYLLNRVLKTGRTKVDCRGNNSGFTPLMLAAIYCSVPAVQVLEACKKARRAF